MPTRHNRFTHIALLTTLLTASLFGAVSSAQDSTKPKNLVQPDDFIVPLKDTIKSGPNIIAGSEDYVLSRKTGWIDKLIDKSTKVRVFALVNNESKPSKGCVGWVLRLGVGESIVTGLRLGSGGEASKPLKLCLEGSNDENAGMAGCANFTVIYEGDSGLTSIPAREFGKDIRFENKVSYKAYRLLFTDTGDAKIKDIKLAEIELIGIPLDPNVKIDFTLPACERSKMVSAKWTDRASVSKTDTALAPSGFGKLWYREPAVVWEEAAPLGNGRLGAMVFGGVADERIQLNEDTLWDGYPSERTNPEALEALPKIQEMMFVGKNSEATMLAIRSMMGNPKTIKPYQSLGELFIETPHLDSNSKYVRMLDLTTAIASVSYTHKDTAFQREMFSSAPAGVIVLRYTADKKGLLDLKMTLTRAQDAVCITNPNDEHSLILKGQIDCKDKDGAQKGLRFAAQLKVVAKGGTVFNKEGILTVTKADEVTIFITGATSYPGLSKIKELLSKDISGKSYSPFDKEMKDPALTCASLIAKASNISYETLKSEHIKDYQNLFNRVSLKLGPSNPKVEGLPTNERLKLLKKSAEPDFGLEALYFQFGRYLLISSSRPGTMPANLQGLWAWEMIPPWEADFHANINIQMNYWPAETTYLSECHEPLFDLMDELTVPGGHFAKAHYGAKGWVVNHLTDPWGFVTPAGGIVGIWPMGAAWLCEHLWEHYQFTQDQKFLAQKAWPLMKGAAEFVMDILVEAPKGTPIAGKLVTNPSYSPENSFFLSDGTTAKFTYGVTMDGMIIYELLSNCVESSKILGLDEDFRKKCEETLARLVPIRISKDGRIMEWIEDYKEAEPEHRHTSHLYALHPSNRITSNTPELFEAARKVLLGRGDRGTGWGLAWKINMWTRLGDGDHAYILLQNLIKNKTLPNLFDVCPPFQIDGNFGATAAFAEMLLQSHIKDAAGNFEIQLLPALPKAWSEGMVSGLRARGLVGVDIEWKDGLLLKATLSPGMDRKVKVRYGSLAKDFDLKKGLPLILNSKLGILQ
jgi:alpha-L-fucosidase 2